MTFAPLQNISDEMKRISSDIRKLQELYETQGEDDKVKTENSLRILEKEYQDQKNLLIETAKNI